MARPAASTVLLVLLPPLTLMCGVAMANPMPGLAERNDQALLGSLAAAAAAPVLAMLILSVVSPSFDIKLVAIAAMLVAIGTSTLFGLAVESSREAEFYMTVVVRHGYFVAAGCVALIAGSIAARRIDSFARYPYSLLALAFVITVTTALAGVTVNGARLWLRLGPLTFQPAEVARVLLATFVAIYLYERRHFVAAPWRVGRLDFPPAPYLAPLAIAVLAAAGVLAFQNDLGMAALLVLGMYAMVATVTGSRSTVLTATALVAAGAVLAYREAPRVRTRVVGWLDPWVDPGGTGFQFVQADFQLAGSGLTGSRHQLASRVPEVHTDFVLIGAGAEFGVLVALALLALSALLVCRCVLCAQRARSGLGALLVMSFATLLGAQILLIAGGALRVLPLTGVTLPLVSYGGTSMIASFFALGIVLGVEAKPDHIRKPRLLHAN